MKRSEVFYQITLKTISVVFVILFVYAATSKLIDFNTFKIQLDRFPFISSYAKEIAYGIPFIEFCIAGLFFFQKYLLLAFYGSLSLMVIFTTYIVLVLNFSTSIPCSCGGILENMGWMEHLIFNIVFVALAIVGILLETNYGYRAKNIRQYIKA